MAATTTINRRGAKAAAAQRAAKERRQMIMIVGLLVVLIAILAFELPKILSRGGSSSSAPTTTTALTPAVVAGPTTSAASTAAQRRALRAALRQHPHDIFVGSVAPSADTLGSVPNPPGLHDPFASPSAPESATAPAAPPPPAPAIKGTIVIGKPGAGTVAVHGWIVILASIPTREGRGSASSFAESAHRGGVGTVSILNSSNRRPLRGGYWVVYTGPFDTLAGVNHSASAVHARGFTSAYVRQLIVYKKKK